MFKRLRLAAVAGMVVVGASIGGAVMTAAPASASASNCPAFPAFWDGHLGNYCAIAFGSGLHVSQVHGTFTDLVHPVCNWTITAEFFDTSWRWYRTFESPVHSGCTTHSATDIYPNYNARTGHMCSTLRSNGNRLTSYCFNIHS